MKGYRFHHRPHADGEPALRDKLARFLPVSVTRKGEGYQRLGRVKLDEHSKTEILACVRGTATYRVALSWKGRHLRGHCTCPYFESGAICKHIWATIEEALRQKLLPPPGGHEIARLVPFWPGETEEPVAAEPAEAIRLLSPLPRAPREQRTPPPAWRHMLDQAGRALRTEPSSEPAREQRLYYALSIPAWKQSGVAELHVLSTQRRAMGEWGKPRAFNAKRDDIARLADPRDREIMLSLRGAARPDYAPYESVFRLDELHWAHALPMLCRSGRFTPNLADPSAGPFLTLDEGEPWVFHAVVAAAVKRAYRLRGEFRRGEQRMAMHAPDLIAQAGWLIADNKVARADFSKAFQWAVALRGPKTIPIPEADVEDFLDAVVTSPARPPLELPDALACTETVAPFVPELVLRDDRYQPDMLVARPSFDYEGRRFEARDPARGYRLAGSRAYRLRDEAGERACLSVLENTGFRPVRYQSGGEGFEHALPVKHLPRALRPLSAGGWRVTFKGKKFRNAGQFTLSVSSGVDWFDLAAKADFDGVAIAMPDLLRAVRERTETVVLADGSMAVIPEDWKRRLAALAAFAKEEDGALRFHRSQAALLDVLLAEQPGVNVDEQFAAAREQVKAFHSIAPADPPATFQGTLRDYQRDGLGWLDFLRAHQFGGCLADDMGLGKTVQVLALLEARRGACAGPSLVVLPKSLLYNWRAEAARFTPAMRVLDHHGLSRARSTGRLSDYDLILTTYGTLRIDAALLKDIEFDYVILDEAQAIKNAATSQAKAARLLRARHRLAMSGTPIENHLGELWSLFEFLNPGFLGRAAVFQGLAADGGDEAARALLARALRPFILRRTKKEVARELPDRTEDTLWCELPPNQRRIYDELRDHYRASLLGAIEAKGLGRSKIQVLEALLRLRQAACHPALIDERKHNEGSAKLEVLLAQVEELREEDHKTLVFSQFTSFLALVRRELDARGIPYEYLDGKTKDRKACVDRFQTDPACKVFLISLKAGGVGLNLTAAEYVFLLDPWWNPAVEAQAIDRAHRIGQTRAVFAYRLIAKDTIEEKVLELQHSKRALADAIISADNSLLKNLTREDLELLLA